jgi:addiction module HigA family antidote
MHNPPHPGEVLKEFIGDLSITSVAMNLGVSRGRLQRIIGGTADISADMAYRLSAAFGTSPDVWAGMQLQYDLYQAGKMKRPKIERISPHAATMT